MISRKNESFIAAQYSLSTIGEIAKELIYNSIDAKATRVSIQIDFEKWMLKVKDDGIKPFLGLELIGKHHISSKTTSNQKASDGANTKSEGANLMASDGANPKASDGANRKESEGKTKATECDSCYGFRGRSLYLISQLSQEVKIITRVKKEFAMKVIQVFSKRN